MKNLKNVLNNLAVSQTSGQGICEKKDGTFEDPQICITIARVQHGRFFVEYPMCSKICPEDCVKQNGQPQGPNQQYCRQGLGDESTVVDCISSQIDPRKLFRNGFCKPPSRVKGVTGEITQTPEPRPTIQPAPPRPDLSENASPGQ